MSERLNREAVERQIREMWDALIDQQVGISPAEYVDLDQAKEQARQCERRLRERLDAQDRLDAAAPYLLEALCDLVDILEAEPFDLAKHCAAWDAANAAIGRAKGAK